MRQSRAKIESRISALEKRRAKEGQMEDKQQANMIRLTGLWDRGGILTGGLSPSAKLVIMPNKIKRSSSDPDAIAYLQAPSARLEEAKQARPAEEPEAEQPSFWWDR